MVKCPRCGYENDDDNKYCENCTYLIGAPDFGRKAKKRNVGWNISTFKKVIIIIGIIFIVLAVFSMVYNYSIPSNQSSLNVIVANETENSNSYNPFQVNISYNGSWQGTMGDPDYPTDKSGKGSNIYRLTSASSWDHIEVYISKEDYSSQNLTVQLLKNGRVVAENSTTEPAGHVELSV